MKLIDIKWLIATLSFGLLSVAIASRMDLTNPLWIQCVIICLIAMLWSADK